MLVKSLIKIRPAIHRNSADTKTNDKTKKTNPDFLNFSEKRKNPIVEKNKSGRKMGVK